MSLPVNSFPYIFGCKQLDTITYESRPLYVLEWTEKDTLPPASMTVLISRSFIDNKEKLAIEDAFDTMGRNYKASLRLREQSLIDSESRDGNSWLDNGSFKYLNK